MVWVGFKKEEVCLALSLSENCTFGSLLPSFLLGYCDKLGYGAVGLVQTEPETV